MQWQQFEAGLLIRSVGELYGLAVDFSYLEILMAPASEGVCTAEECDQYQIVLRAVAKCVVGDRDRQRAREGGRQGKPRGWRGMHCRFPKEGCAYLEYDLLRRGDELWLLGCFSHNFLWLGQVVFVFLARLIKVLLLKGSHLSERDNFISIFVFGDYRLVLVLYFFGLVFFHVLCWLSENALALL